MITNRSLQNSRSSIYFLLTVFLALVAHTASAQNTGLVMDSAQGDFVGQGLSYYYTPANGTFTVTKNGANGVSISFSNSGHNWHLDFAAPGNALLTPGTYEDAVRYPAFQSPTRPAFDVYGDGRGENTIPWTRRPG